MLKSFREDDVPTLVTGGESNLASLLESVRSDGGQDLVSEAKVEAANKQLDTFDDNGSRIPVTIITGYLGSGKSTLVEKLVSSAHGRRIAVIVNEFADTGEIERAMTVRDGPAKYEEWLDLGNGCLCCSLQNAGVRAIEDMVARSPGRIDYIVLETSGLADPAPVAKMFWQDTGLQSKLYVDGIVAVLDAEHVTQALDGDQDTSIAHIQIALADRLVLNKIDRISESAENLTRITSRIASINSAAEMRACTYGSLPVEFLLDIHAFDSQSLASFPSTHAHDPHMTTVVLNFRPLLLPELEKLHSFLQHLLWTGFGIKESRVSVQRTKGLLSVGDTTYILQGVRNTYDILPSKTPAPEDCKIVLIGKHLVEETLTKRLKDALGDS